MFLAKAYWCKPFTKHKYQQAEKKINNERRKEKNWMAVSMKSMLNIPHGSSLRAIHTLYKGVEKVLTSHRICRHAFAFQARKCVKYKKNKSLYWPSYIILQTGTNCKTFSCLMTTCMYTTSTGSIDQNQTAPIGIVCYNQIMTHSCLIYN